MAIALLMHPEISQRLTSIWVGGGRYPKGNHECNLNNDMLATQIVLLPQCLYGRCLVKIRV